MAKVKNETFNRMYQEMKAWVGEQKKAGWQSPEVEKHATAVMWCLWSLSQLDPTPAIMLKSLDEHTKNLAEAKAKQPPS